MRPEEEAERADDGDDEEDVPERGDWTIGNFLGIYRGSPLGIFRGTFRRSSGPRSFLGNSVPRNSVGNFRGISKEK
uniref:Uncharacterized protein n=1 Tax=Brassica oleracea TaxID=3712 RepID=A0A3P6AUZ2_BRAOL|nr:unnamed protein product [Brassica oleracea]